jgi:hypothetical protein
VLVEKVKKVEQIWKNEGLKIAEPLSENNVVESFANLSILLSQEIIDVYSNLGGMIDEDMDSVCFSFWTVERILTENKPNSELTFFADFLINSHWFGFKFENESVSSIHIYWQENQIEKIADSFDEFLATYTTNPGKYYMLDREKTDEIIETKR